MYDPSKVKVTEVKATEQQKPVEKLGHNMFGKSVKQSDKSMGSGMIPSRPTKVKTYKKPTP